jgi:predicted nuclease of predicted toxin-antitoxin system
MKFLSDQDVYNSTIKFLVMLGHDVVTASQVGLSQASDEELLKKSNRENRILVTRDRDFGNLVFVKSQGTGVLYLRMLPSTQNVLHSELKKVLITYTEQELKETFVVIEPDGHRIRRLPNE